jgi:hypothetical protein
MNIVMLLIPLSFMNESFAGGTCSKNDVKPLKRHYSFSSATLGTMPENTQEHRIKREKEIRFAVWNMPLPTIYILHERMDYDDYGPLNMNPDEIEIFRNCVHERYNDNVVEINIMVQESVERYRQRVHRLAVRQKNMNRRRRFAWRSEDRAIFQAINPALESKEEKIESIPVA